MPRIQLRRDTSSNWSSTNPTLYAGEIGVETDTMSYKLGDGSTNWNSLAYASLPDGVNDGDVLTWNSSTNSWQAEAPTGGGGSLPNGTTDGQVLTWDGTNSSWSAEAVPTELPSATDGQVLTWTSSTNTWIAATPNAAGLPNGTNTGDVLTWDGINSSWSGAAIPSALPNGTTDGQVLTWDSTTNSWGPENVPAELPPSATVGQVLTWASNNSWEPQTPTATGLPSGSTQFEQLVWNAGGVSWQAGGVPPNSGGFLAYNQGSYGFNGMRPGPSDAATHDILYYNGSYWEARPYVAPGANSADLLGWDATNNNWVATNNSGAVHGNIIYWDSGNTSWTLGGLTSMAATPNTDDVLKWNGSMWQAGVVTASLPSGSTSNQVLWWDNTAGSWQPAAVACVLPSANNGDVLSYDSATSCWAGVAPSAAGLPAASANLQVMRYNSSTAQWEAGPGLAGGATDKDFLFWDSANNTWNTTGFGATPTTGHIVFNQSGSWVLGGLTDGSSGATPSDGEVLTWNNTNSLWEASPPPGALPSGNDKDVLTFNASNTSWEAKPGIPDGTAEHDILVWAYDSGLANNKWTALGVGALTDGHILNVAASGSQWTLGGKTAANGNPATNDVLQWNGNNWVAATIPILPTSSINAWDIVHWDSSSNLWAQTNLTIAQSSNYALTFDGNNWTATNTPASSSIVIVDVSSSSHTLSFTNGVLTSYSIT